MVGKVPAVETAPGGPPGHETRLRGLGHGPGRRVDRVARGIPGAARDDSESYR
jgi:hypothetical protein